MAKKKSKKSTSTNPVSDALRQIVADTYALMGQTHLCHWNVEGPGFFALHTAFEEQYTELFAAVDEIAERIRALGSYAPGGLGNLAAMAGYEELKENATDKEMVSHLATLHKQTIKNLVTARNLAGDEGDDQTEDLMIARIQVHEKTVWMLESYLK
ncbi:Dps family protein [Cerasicoccus frondis]|uniref:Dps family protein n=1 Tax=Cerasicoccus frondis TaxID=490090 RepID=UPI002852D6ED|nr:DNA starvation/stationary phase protection protein [Cerasicoccus frondis]